MTDTRIPTAVIINAICEAFCVDRNEMMSVRRAPRVAHARQAAFMLVRELRGLSLHQLGNVFGGRDHTTILHGIRQSEWRRKNLVKFSDQYDAAKRKALSWAPGVVLTFVMPTPADYVAERREIPPAVKFEAPSAVSAPIPLTRAKHRDGDPIEVRLMRESGQRATDAFAARLAGAMR